MNERAQRELVADYARRLHARGWVGNHDGNVSARAGEGRFVCTPTATSKAAVTADGLLIVNDKGERVAGNAKPFGEMGLHLTVFARRPEVNVVVHAHPPAATGLACSGSRLLERPFIAEAVVSLGASIPTVPFAPPGLEACRALAPFVAEHDAVLLGNHGVLAWGGDVEQAYLRLELVEHLARIALAAEQAGGVKPLPESALPALLEARRKAFGLPGTGTGTGPGAGTGKAVTRVVACAPAPPGSDVEVITKPTRPQADLATVIREELMRVLKNS